MKSIPPVVYYTVLRLLAFAIPLTLLLLLGIEPWIATVLAALIGLSLSYVTLRKPREAVSRDLYELRHGAKTAAGDEDAEDSVTDVTATDATASDSTSRTDR
ncbi:MAG: DUF4229 domain-containing protein [Mycetocola sp.]